MDHHGRGGSGPLSIGDWVTGLAEQASLLQAHGHPEARHYPVPRLWAETRIVRRRVNRELVNSAVLTQMAIASVLSKEAAKAFNKQIKALTER